VSRLPLTAARLQGTKLNRARGAAVPQITLAVVLAVAQQVKEEESPCTVLMGVRVAPLEVQRPLHRQALSHVSIAYERMAIAIWNTGSSAVRRCCVHCCIEARSKEPPVLFFCPSPLLVRRVVRQLEKSCGSVYLYLASKKEPNTPSFRSC